MHDVAIIGAGVIGCCVARELSRFALKTVVLEKGSDVSSGTSKANSGIVHEGYDAKPGSLKAKYNVLGQKMFDALSKELDFPFKRKGSLVVAFDAGSTEKLEELKINGEKNGLTDLKILFKDEIKKLEKNLSDNVYAALYAPSAGIVSPYEMTIALAENAVSNGVMFMLNSEVINIDKKENCFRINLINDIIETKLIINAAGVYSGHINNMLSAKKINITPRRGEYCLLDKTEGTLIGRTIFQLPSHMGKGILVTPTVDGNILIGPTAVDITDKDDTSTTMEGLAEVLEKARLSVNKLPSGKIITSFAGLRARADKGDFIIEEAEDVPELINLCGIESPGLSAAPAIGKEVARMVAAKLNPKENKNFNPIRKGIAFFRNMSDEERKSIIKDNLDYGQIICRCELVTKGEIIAALRTPINVYDLDAVKRRTRAGMGRCQSGFCNMRLLEIITEELSISITDVKKSDGESNILIERNKFSC